MIYDLQKASVWKRISAYLFDTILLFILAAGLAFLLSTILGYDKQSAAMQDHYARYEEEYGISFDITMEEFESFSEDQKSAYMVANEAWQKDADVIRTYSLVVNLTLLITSFGILFAYLLLELLVPHLIGNGQTLGKKIFGIALMKTNGVKINFVSLFIRTLLGKYTLETMIPFYVIVMLYFNMNTFGVVGLAILLLLPLLQLVFFATTRTHSLIHDLLANTVAVDMASQMIFDSEEALLEYKNKRHADEVQKNSY